MAKEAAMTNRNILYATMGLLWAVNPVLPGCSSPEFSFGETEMLDLMETINGQTWTTEDGEYELTLTLEQGGGEQAALELLDWMASAHACGDRSFVAEAEACLESSSLPIDATVTITELETEVVIIEEAPYEGTMFVYGYDLDNAELNLHSDEDEIT